MMRNENDGFIIRVDNDGNNKNDGQHDEMVMMMVAYMFACQEKDTTINGVTTMLTSSAMSSM